MKDPASRLRDAGDVRLEIDEILSNPASESDATTPALSKPSGLRNAVIAAVVLIIGMLAATTAWWLKPEGPSIPLRKFSIRAPDGASISGAVISPDGRSVAMIVGGTLRVRRLDSLDMSEVPGASEVNAAFWSPDSINSGFNDASPALVLRGRDGSRCSRRSFRQER